MKVGILYICTGRYSVFWESFYKSAEKYLLPDGDIEKHYFVFTNAENIVFEQNCNVTKIYQEELPWPYITLYRFKIFERVFNILNEMDYLYFFNANMIFVDTIRDDILPTIMQPLVFTIHPGYFDKDSDTFSYEKNPNSLAYIPSNKGLNYFMGGLNGGLANRYLEMVKELKDRIEKDENRNIIAIWHDESHLNCYAIEHRDEIKKLSPAYGYPEGWSLPFEKKVLIQDKNKFGGHGFLRKTKHTWFQQLLKYFR